MPTGALTAARCAQFEPQAAARRSGTAMSPACNSGCRSRVGTARYERAATKTRAPDQTRQTPVSVASCHAYAANGNVVRRVRALRVRGKRSGGTLEYACIRVAAAYEAGAVQGRLNVL